MSFINKNLKSFSLFDIFFENNLLFSLSSSSLSLELYYNINYNKLGYLYFKYN